MAFADAMSYSTASTYPVRFQLVICSVFVFFMANAAFSQSKKKQIEQLNGIVDSLYYEVLMNEKENEAYLSQMASLKLEISTLKNDLDKSQRERDELTLEMDRCARLNIDVNREAEQLRDSLRICKYKNRGGISAGTVQEGDPNGGINGRGVLGGGGSAGTGGGTGGGNGTGNGVGSGSGSGMSWKLDGRTMKSTPKVNGTAPDEGTVTVDIWVDANGNVTKAMANAAKSNTSNGTLFKMAEDAARKAKFSSSASGNEQKGSIKITFKLN
jgi:TonB family protein